MTMMALVEVETTTMEVEAMTMEVEATTTMEVETTTLEATMKQAMENIKSTSKKPVDKSTSGCPTTEQL